MGRNYSYRTCLNAGCFSIVRYVDGTPEAVFTALAENIQEMAPEDMVEQLETDVFCRYSYPDERRRELTDDEIHAVITERIARLGR